MTEREARRDTCQHGYHPKPFRVHPDRHKVDLLSFMLMIVYFPFLLNRQDPAMTQGWGQMWLLHLHIHPSHSAWTPKTRFPSAHLGPPWDFSAGSSQWPWHWSPCFPPESPYHRPQDFRMTFSLVYSVSDLFKTLLYRSLSYPMLLIKHNRTAQTG